MPIVPSNVLPMRRPEAEGFEQAKPSQTDIAIAAANMDSMGRLFEPQSIDEVFAGKPQAQVDFEKAAGEHMIKQGVKPGEIFEYKGETYSAGKDGAFDRASEQQIIEHSTKKLRERR